MDLLPYVKDFGLGSGLVTFFVLYLREIGRHDETRLKLLALIPQCVTAIVSNTAALTIVTELVREGTRRARDG
jgi:hypothetical protein